MPPKKYSRNHVTYSSQLRRPARRSKPSDPQENPTPLEESQPSTLTPPNLETPSQSTLFQESTTPVVESQQTLINENKIDSNVQESPPFSVVTPNLETPLQQNTNLGHSDEIEIETPVVELQQTLINGSEIGSNVQDFGETVSRAADADVELKHETLVEKELVNDGGYGKRALESETKNVVKKKKTKIVKRIVKRKVLKKVNHQQAEVLKIGRNEGADMEVENSNLKNVETSDHSNNVVTGIEHCESSYVVGKSADGCESGPTCIIWSEAENCSVVGEKQKDLEAFEVVKHCVDVENLIKSHSPSLDVGIMQDQNYDCIVENRLDSEIGDYKQAEETRDCKQEEETRDCKQEDGVENNQDFGSEDDKEGVNSKGECSQFGGMKAETSLGDTLLSGEMGALERRRRRKTEIFIGGLDKDVREEDIRKIFEVLGEIKDVTLVNSSKTKDKAFAFVRYTLADDAKKALIKFHQVEICGRLCGTSPVEGNDTLFLGNINKRWKSDDVTKLLQGIGIEKIDHVTVMSDPSNIELNRGFAFLELESNKDAQNAYKKLQKKGVLGKHLHIKVAWAEPLIEPDESELSKVKSVYAEYLPSSWDEEKVKNCFKRFGDIKNVALARDMPSSRRKDFAFVNYTTRDAALACVEAFIHEQTNDKDSKVKIKVSLAKPFPKGQQIRHIRTPPTTESKVNPKGTPFVKSLQGSRITGNLTSSNYDTRIVDQRSSMTSELVQLLREQASMRPTNPSLGFVNRQHPYPLSGRKRPFPVQGDGSHFFDPRGHPRARVEGSYPITNPSVPFGGVSRTSLPHHQQGASYISSKLNYHVNVVIYDMVFFMAMFFIPLQDQFMGWNDILAIFSQEKELPTMEILVHIKDIDAQDTSLLVAAATLHLFIACRAECFF